MATGSEMYDAVRNALREIHDIPRTLQLNPLDAIDLQKLTPEDLIGKGYDPSIAGEVSSDLFKGIYSSLEQTMGASFEISQEQPSLLDN